jgi:DNA-binding MarR family transcriptional regulator
VLLTPKGRKALEQVRAQAGRIFQQAFHDVSDAEIKGLNEVLQHLFHNLENTPR